MLNNILNIVHLQNELNSTICGEDWCDGDCDKTNKRMYWDLAIVAELGEFIDSTDFKHWKHVEVNKENAILELVDIFHFLLSKAISTTDRREQTLFNISNDEILKYVADGITDIVPRRYVSYNVKDINVLVGELISLLYSKDENSHIDVFKPLFELLSMFGVDMNELCDRYIMKNTLNIFRNRNGYTEGTYNKTWNGIEDNEVLENIFLDSNYIEFDKIYSELELRYKQIT